MQHICQSELASNSEPASDPSDSGSDQDQKTHLTFLPLLSLLTSYLSHPSAEHRHLTSFLLLSCTASLVDGYNLPLRITNSVGCPVADCPVDLGPGCTCLFFFLRGGRAAKFFFFCGGVDWGLTIELWTVHISMLGQRCGESGRSTDSRSLSRLGHESISS